MVKVTCHSLLCLRTALSDGTLLDRAEPSQLKACSCSLAFVLIKRRKKIKALVVFVGFFAGGK